MNNIQKALAATFKDFIYIVLAVSFALNFYALDYILLSQSTTLRIMGSQNIALFNWSAVVLSATIGVFFGISSAMLVYILKRRRENAAETAPSTAFGTLFAAVASGCPVCGVWLLPLLGIAGSLAVFPFQGLEIKVMAIGLLIFSIAQSSSAVLGICKPGNAKKRVFANVAVISAFVAVLFLLPYTPQQYKVKFQRNGVSAPTQQQVAFNANIKTLRNQVNPDSGFALPINYSNFGYRLVEDGVIDFDKFSQVYDRSGTPLSQEQLKIFSKEGLAKPIVINRENAYFLLNLFWAIGLANENPILTEGQIVTYGNGRISDFASTGGWTIASKPLSEYFAKSKLVTLSEPQQQRLQKVAEGAYRPCCGNSTAFPDCNHGMALLGMLELMAANNATEAEMFEAAKYFSAYWFPQQAFDVATYFMATEQKSFKEIDPVVFVSQQFFSGGGWSQVKGWIDKNIGSTTKGAAQGGGCGV